MQTEQSQWEVARGFGRSAEHTHIHTHTLSLSLQGPWSAAAEVWFRTSTEHPESSPQAHSWIMQHASHLCAKNRTMGLLGSSLHVSRAGGGFQSSIPQAQFVLCATPALHCPEMMELRKHQKTWLENL